MPGRAVGARAGRRTAGMAPVCSRAGAGALLSAERDLLLDRGLGAEELAPLRSQVDPFSDDRRLRGGGGRAQVQRGLLACHRRVHLP
ncbi:MAG TPA: hypothetical protein VML54_10490 [Candidatus Limnocylindrales bacterium]|nr:hypothetical protein [Candidatus Limnocylindrales bacterium]